MPLSAITRTELKAQVMNSLNHSEAPLSVEDLCGLHPVAPLRIRRALRALNAEGEIDYVKQGRYRFASPATVMPRLTDGETQVFTAISLDVTELEDMAPRSFSARVGSLVKKGLLERSENGEVMMTELGEKLNAKSA